jgi:DNA-binding NtrC family response regulator
MSPAAPAPGPVVLAVDDEQEYLATYRRLLGRDGFRVVTAASRAEALSALASEKVRVIVTDVRLADGDGLDVVRAGLGSHGTPAIVVTGFATAEVRQAARAAGAAEFFAKPFAAAALAARVRELAGR